MPQEPSIFLAFGLGILSILSPCILPLIPSFLGYISGMKIEDEKINRSKLILHTFLFTLGFSIVLVILGATASKIGYLTLLNRALLEKIAGALIILIALSMMGIFTFTFKSTSNKIASFLSKVKFGRSFLTGLFFAFGWSPCISLVLASVLALAATEASLTRGVILLTSYAAGLSLSFILAALALDRFVDFSKLSRKITLFVKYFSGAILMVLGILLISGKFSLVVSVFYNIFSKMGIIW